MPADIAGFRIRVATRPEMGGGHLTRMRTLAAALRRHGPVAFIIDDDSTDACQRLAAEGYDATEASALPSGRCAATVVDCYDVGDGERAHYAGNGPLVLIDDMGVPRPGADLVVNAGFGYTGDVLGGTPALLGPAFALIDPRYASTAQPTAANLSNVLLTFGLGDPDNVTGKALEGVLRAITPECNPTVTVVMGSRVPHLSDVATSVEANRSRCRLLVDVADMLPVVHGADLVVGAGGVSLFERAAAGTPSITVSIADNHRYFSEMAGNAGVTHYLGNSHDVTADDFAAAFTALSSSPDRRGAMAARGSATVDGRGAARVADAIVLLAASRADHPTPHLTMSAK